MASGSLVVRPAPAHMLVASWRDSFFIADMLSGLARSKLPERPLLCKVSMSRAGTGSLRSTGAVATPGVPSLDRARRPPP